MENDRKKSPKVKTVGCDRLSTAVLMEDDRLYVVAFSRLVFGDEPSLNFKGHHVGKSVVFDLMCKEIKKFQFF